MMGNKGTCKTGGDFDLLYAKKWYCYLSWPSGVRKIKRSMRKRLRNNQNREMISQLGELKDE